MCGWQVEETLSKIAANMHSWKELKGVSCCSRANTTTIPPVFSPSQPNSLTQPRPAACLVAVGEELRAACGSRILELGAALYAVHEAWGVRLCGAWGPHRVGRGQGCRGFQGVWTRPAGA